MWLGITNNNTIMGETIKMAKNQVEEKLTIIRRQKKV